MKYILPILFALILCSCDGESCVIVRYPGVKKAFNECLEKTKVNRDVNYNDTSEMIDSCRYAANSITAEYTVGVRKDYICVPVGDKK